MAESLADKARRRALEKGLLKETPSESPDDIAGLMTMGLEDMDLQGSTGGYDEELQRVVDGLDVVTAYNLFCGKQVVDPGGRTESIKCRCPRPDHEDKNPSAWMNTEKDVWHCGGCEKGGDKYDIVAFSMGYTDDSYKAPGEFPKVKRYAAERLGYTTAKTPTGKKFLTVVPETSEEPAHVERPTMENVEPIKLVARPNSSDPERVAPLPWQDILPESTFLRKWMELTTQDDLPEEYYLWLGLLGVGLALGDDVSLVDYKSVRANLFVCLHGATGIGKSRAIHPLLKLLEQAVPFDPDEPASIGVKLIGTQGSAESLIDQFAHYDEDFATKKKTWWPVRGLVNMDELSSLMSRASRRGNPIKPTLMELYDLNADTVSVTSRGHGATQAYRPFCSMLTTSQPNSLGSLVSGDDASAGFLNRWVFAAGTPKRPESYGQRPLSVTDLIQPYQAIRSWASRKMVYRLEGETYDAWDALYHQHLTTMRNSSEVSTRVDLLLKKIAIILSADQGHDRIMPETIRRLELFLPYLSDCYRLVDSRVMYEKTNVVIAELSEILLEQIPKFHKKYNKWPSVRDVMASITRRYDRSTVLTCLSVLVATGELQEVVGTAKKGAATTTRYAVVQATG